VIALRRRRPCEQTVAVQNIEEGTGQDIFEDHRLAARRTMGNPVEDERDSMRKKRNPPQNEKKE
jgi:hypothetical protein